MKTIDFSECAKLIKNADPIRYIGKVTRVVGLTVEVSGIHASIGEVCRIPVDGCEEIVCEVVGFRETQTLLMPLGDLKGISPGCRVLPMKRQHSIGIGEELMGQVLDGLGRPLNQDFGSITEGTFAVQNDPPNPMERQRIDRRLETGIKALDLFATCGRGQRLGIFSGSGVGKSTLLGMVARYCTADVNVLAFIGERGREVREFLERDLGEEGLKRSVVVVATSDQPPLVRIKGAFVATAIAEYFRDQGMDVMLMMDSLTRFAAAQREIGLAVGEPPATRGYTPSVFATLPKLLERAGRSEKGSITGLYSVLVEADDFNEPISDAVRGILDGHIVLSRQLASQNHYPAMDVLNSLSRLMPQITTHEHQELAGQAREYMAAYEEARDLISIGAYKKGSNAVIDKALDCYPKLMRFLKQEVEESCLLQESLQGLVEIVA